MSLRRDKKVVWAFLLVLAAVLWLLPFYAGKVKSAVNVRATVPNPAVCGNNAKESGEQCDNADLGGETCASQGFASGTLTCHANCTLDTSLCTSVAETVTVQPVSNVTGSAVNATNTDNTVVALTFPPNFYNQTVDLRAFSYDSNHFLTEKPAVSGENFIGKTYDLNLYLASSGDQISSVSKAVTITLPYTSFEISGFDEGTLKPYRWGANDASWQLISGSVINTTNKNVTFTTADFSSFALMASPPSSALTRFLWGGGVVSAIKSLFSEHYLPSRAADFNHDGKIDIADLSILLYHYGEKSTLYDLNSDGKIDIIDVSILFYLWNG